MAVRRRFCHRIDRDHPARAGAVLDDDRLAELPFHVRLDRARHHVGAAAGRKSEKEANRL